ncbi:MAG: hypothetical protein ABL959_21120, partial [Pyrinomonadaceae bacterium]
MLFKTAVAIGLLGLSACSWTFRIGNSKFIVPTGWREIRSNAEKVIFASPGGDQQATISIMKFDTSASFEDFKILCEQRVRDEEAAARDVRVYPEEAFEDEGKFRMLCS